MPLRPFVDVTQLKSIFEVAVQVPVAVRLIVLSLVRRLSSCSVGLMYN